MRSVIVSLLIGLVTSVLGAYLYAGLQTTTLDPIKVLPWTLLLAATVWTAMRYRFLLRILWDSGVSGYFPKGQAQYITQMMVEVRESSTVTVVGARGQDLVGEDSPIGDALKNWGESGVISAYLLHPDSPHGRLRSGYLDVEREKYTAECVSVHNYPTL